MTPKRSTAGKTKGGKHISQLTLREQKRNVGYELLRQGCTKAQVAKAVCVSWVTANRWTKQLQTKKARKHDKKRSGRPVKLSISQRAKLKRILKNGAQQYGYPTELWTLKRVSEVINKEFDVKYNTTHVWRVLRSMGFSAQVPLLRAMERDEKYISCARPSPCKATKLGFETIVLPEFILALSYRHIYRSFSRRAKRYFIRP